MKKFGMVPVVEKFSGIYLFLSNFYPCTIPYQGYIYPSVEHAYQAAKTLNETERQIIQKCKAAAQAKRKGKNINATCRLE